MRKTESKQVNNLIYHEYNFPVNVVKINMFTVINVVSVTTVAKVTKIGIYQFYPRSKSAHHIQVKAPTCLLAFNENYSVTGDKSSVVGNIGKLPVASCNVTLEFNVSIAIINLQKTRFLRSPGEQGCKIVNDIAIAAYLLKFCCKSLFHFRIVCLCLLLLLSLIC